MKKLFILFLLGVLLISACNKNYENDSFEVRYIISGGFVPREYGDWHDTLIIKNDGTIIRDLKEKEQTLDKIRLSEDEFKDFKDLVLKSNVFDFDSDYNCENNNGLGDGCVADAPIEKLEFYINDEAKSITMLTSDYAPEEIRDIIEKLEYFKGKFENGE